MKNQDKYQQLTSLLPENTFRPGDVVIAYGKHRLVTESRGGLVVVGKGRGHTLLLSVNNITALVARNLKLKPGVKFCGVVGE